MLIRKKTGEADGFSSAVCLRSCTVFDDEGPQNVIEGQEYFVQGEVDPVIFDVDGYVLEEVSPNGEEHESGEIEEEVE